MGSPTRAERGIESYAEESGEQHWHFRQRALTLGPMGSICELVRDTDQPGLAKGTEHTAQRERGVHPPPACPLLCRPSSARAFPGHPFIPASCSCSRPAGTRLDVRSGQQVQQSLICSPLAV